MSDLLTVTTKPIINNGSHPIGTAWLSVDTSGYKSVFLSMAHQECNARILRLLADNFNAMADVLDGGE